MFDAISGFLFLFIIVVLMLATQKFGYEVYSKSDAEAKLQAIIEDPKRFRTSVVLVLLEHVAIVSLAISLFIAFSPYNILLGIIWLIARSGEGLVQIYYKKDYWSLRKLARQYPETSGVERDILVNSTRSILKTKNTVFSGAQILFSIGTLSYSILFAFYGVVPVLIGWFGIVSSIIYGIGNAVILEKPSNESVWNLGGLLIFIFELVLGAWLLLSSLLSP
jgi:hypothetical protein